jgi:hypothetical protein
MTTLELFNKIAETAIQAIKDPAFNTTVAIESDDTDEFIGTRFCHNADIREKLIKEKFQHFNLQEQEIEQVKQLYAELNHLLFLLMEHIRNAMPSLRIQYISSVINSILTAIYCIVPQNTLESFNQIVFQQSATAFTLQIAEKLDQLLVSHQLLLTPALQPLCEQSRLQTTQQTTQQAPHTRFFSFRPLFNSHRLIENTRNFIHSFNCFRRM